MANFYVLSRHAFKRKMSFFRTMILLDVVIKTGQYLAKFELNNGHFIVWYGYGFDKSETNRK